jgi:dihydrofolate reductase
MRKLVATFFVSLDGVVEAPQNWHFPYHSDDQRAAVAAQLDASDALVLGRLTYEEFAPVWPTSQDEFADQYNSVRKYVVSTTLQNVDWNNSTVIRSDPAAGLAALKQRPGKDILINGSGTLVRSLLAGELIDELQLMIHPVVVGRGARLFPNPAGHQTFRLVDSETFTSGVVYVTYQCGPRGSAVRVFERTLS